LGEDIDSVPVLFYTPITPLIEGVDRVTLIDGAGCGACGSGLSRGHLSRISLRSIRTTAALFEK
jgi:hypothetical protein